MSLFNVASNFLNTIPGVGHAIGIIHYACGDRRGGNEAIQKATRTSILLTGATAAISLGPLGVITGTLISSSIYDCVSTMATDEPQGIVKNCVEIVNSAGTDNAIPSVAKGAIDLADDVVSGLVGAKLFPNPFKSLEKELLKASLKPSLAKTLTTVVLQTVPNPLISLAKACSEELTSFSNQPFNRPQIKFQENRNTKSNNNESDRSDKSSKSDQQSSQNNRSNKNNPNNNTNNCKQNELEISKIREFLLKIFKKEILKTIFPRITDIDLEYIERVFTGIAANEDYSSEDIIEIIKQFFSEVGIKKHLLKMYREKTFDEILRHLIKEKINIAEALINAGKDFSKDMRDIARRLFTELKIRKLLLKIYKKDRLGAIFANFSDTDVRYLSGLLDDENKDFSSEDIINIVKRLFEKLNISVTYPNFISLTSITLTQIRRLAGAIYHAYKYPPSGIREFVGTRGFRNLTFEDEITIIKRGIIKGLLENKSTDNFKELLMLLSVETKQIGLDKIFRDDFAAADHYYKHCMVPGENYYMTAKEYLYLYEGISLKVEGNMPEWYKEFLKKVENKPNLTTQEYFALYNEVRLKPQLWSNKEELEKLKNIKGSKALRFETTINGKEVFLVLKFRGKTLVIATFYFDDKDLEKENRNKK